MFILHSHFPQEMSLDVKATFCHSFSFAVATEQQADIDERYLSCAHTSEGPPKWSPQWIPLPAETRMTGRARQMHKWWVKIIHCTPFSLSKNESFFFFFPCPPPHLRSVNVSTCTWFPGHSQALKVNTSFTSSRILTSIIKAVSRAICIILSSSGRPGSSGAAHAEQMDLMKFEDIQTAAAQQEASDSGELPLVCYYYFLYKWDYWLLFYYFFWLDNCLVYKMPNTQKYSSQFPQAQGDRSFS